MKEILTTFDIARICAVDITTVINWINGGKLAAYKTPGGHRRVRKKDFVVFMNVHQIYASRRVGDVIYNVLIAESDEQTRAVIRNVLKRLWPGIDIWEASDGFSAGKLTAEKQPALLVLNMRLDGINAAKVCRMIRDDRRLTHTRILAVLASSLSKARDEAVDAGADYCIVRPFTADRFKSFIKGIIP